MLAILKLRLLSLRQSYLIILVMTAMSLVLTFAFGGMAGNTTYKPDLALVNNSDSALSEELIKDLEAERYYNIVELSMMEATEAIGNSDFFAGVIIDESFGTSTTSLSEGIHMMALKNDAEIMTLEGNLSNTLSKMNQKEKLVAIGSAIFTQIPGVDALEQADKIRANYDKQWLYRKPLLLESRSYGDSFAREANTKGIILGFAIMFSAYTMVFGIGDILTDKQDHTWQRMMVSPLKKSHILLGYSVVTILVGCLQLFVVFFVGQYLFSISWGGHVLAMMLVIFAYVFALTCMGLLLSTFVKTPSQLSAFTPIILTSFAMLGGCLWPLEVVSSKVLLLLANITPHKWAMEALGNITIKNLPLQASLDSILILFVMGILTFALSVYRIERDLNA